MSRGLGEKERFIIDVLTHDAPDFSEFEEGYIFGFYRLGINNFEDIPAEGICTDLLLSNDKKDVCLYMSVIRALRSLEKKGFICSRSRSAKERFGDWYSDVLEDAKEDGWRVRGDRVFSFNVKCLVKFPWQLKYLNKRLSRKKGVKHLNINENEEGDLD